MQENSTEIQNRVDGVKQYLVEQFELTNDQIEGMLPVFIETLHSHMSELGKFAGQDNLQEMNKMAHTLKGALLNLGLKDLAETALKLEKFDVQQGSVEQCHAMIEDLRRQVLSLHL